MARLIKIENIDLTDPQQYCKELESGNILFFPKCPFDFPKEELDFLLAQRQTGATNRKNIAYKPKIDKITNFVQSSDEQGQMLLQVMRGFSQRSISFLTDLLSPYATKWKLDYASFRPFQEKGRKLRTRARNDLLHTDAFPSRPMHGNRILRFFININPLESRYWMTSDPLQDLACRFGGANGVPYPKGVTNSFADKMFRMTKKLAHEVGLPVVLRSPYDRFMLNLHNFLKENEEFQNNCHKDYWEFPPGCCWAVYTDQVSHAATAGQYALEQTLIIPHDTLVLPDVSPLKTLERLSGRVLIDPLFARK